MYKRVYEHQTFPTAIIKPFPRALTACIYMFSRNKEVLILGGMDVVLHSGDLHAALYITLKQM